MSEKLNNLKCPRCKKPVSWEGNPHRPFCSEKCRLIDLGQWSDEAYRIPAESPGEENLENLIDMQERKNSYLKGH